MTGVMVSSCQVLRPPGCVLLTRGQNIQIVPFVL